MPATDPTTLRRQATPIAKALNTIAQATGQPFTMTTEGGRFRIQKTVYLLRHLGYPSAQRFDYNLYFMGPYSPELSRCYYALDDDGIQAAGTTDDVPVVGRDLLVEALNHSDEFLEGLTTLLDVHREMTHLPAALAHAKAIKAHIEHGTWGEVKVFLQTHRALTRAT